MKFIRDLFSEDHQASCMRVMAMLCCIAAIVIAIIGISKPQIDFSGLTLLCSTFLGAAFTGKVMQKRIETSNKT